MNLTLTGTTGGVTVSVPLDIAVSSLRRLGPVLTAPWTYEGDDWTADANGVLTSGRGALAPISADLGMVEGKTYAVTVRVEREDDDPGELVSSAGNLTSGTYEFDHVATGPVLTLDPSTGPTGDFRGEAYPAVAREIIA